MPDWTSYHPSDFIPFTKDVYLRLLERVNETYWPLHIPLLLTAIAILALIRRGSSTAALCLLAVIWIWVGYGFLLQFYHELNWAGRWFGSACFVQALFLLLLSIQSRQNSMRPTGAGLTLCAISLLWPWVSPLGRENWTQLEWIGIHADPTMVFSFGVLLMLRTKVRLLLFIIPLSWCLLSAVTLQVLGLIQAWILGCVLLIAVLTVLFASFNSTKSN